MAAESGWQADRCGNRAGSWRQGGADGSTDPAFRTSLDKPARLSHLGEVAGARYGYGRKRSGADVEPVDELGDVRVVRLDALTMLDGPNRSVRLLHVEVEPRQPTTVIPVQLR